MTCWLAPSYSLSQPHLSQLALHPTTLLPARPSSYCPGNKSVLTHRQRCAGVECHLLITQELYKQIVKLLVASEWPWWEYLHHRNWQIVQTPPPHTQRASLPVHPARLLSCCTPHHSALPHVLCLSPACQPSRFRSRTDSPRKTCSLPDLTSADSLSATGKCT